jgi:hypothetical protein
MTLFGGNALGGKGLDFGKLLGGAVGAYYGLQNGNVMDGLMGGYAGYNQPTSLYDRIMDQYLPNKNVLKIEKEQGGM